MMNRDTVIKALSATKDSDEQKHAESFLDERPGAQELGTGISSSRTTTTSTDGIDRVNLSVPTNDDALAYKIKISNKGIAKQEHVASLVEIWRNAARKAVKIIQDPWSNFFVCDIPIMRARRYRYSSIRKSWTEDIVEIRLLQEPFARGSIRECYRLKKLPSNNRVHDWKHAHNYVAKKYMQEVNRSVYFEDVRLQMDAKLWAEEYNRCDPPKKIDIVQMCLLEVIDMPSEPLFHLEHFIEGEYMKYNSNSGFVSEVARKTPQAFSHFTFERSGHQLMVVDIQGVGDLYTDPQIHTVIGTDYGDGNLGTRGMALFFHSHLCNDICHSLYLTEFDLSDAERSAINNCSAASFTNQSTVFAGPANACSPVALDFMQENTMESPRLRRTSFRSLTSSTGDYKMESFLVSGELHSDDCICEDCFTHDATNIASKPFTDCVDNINDECEDREHCFPRKVGLHTLSVEHRERSNSFASSCGSSSLGSSSRITRDTERDEYWSATRKKSIPAGILLTMEMQNPTAELTRVSQHTCILGQIHLDLARYHEMGRFLFEEDNEDKRIALGENDPSSDTRISSSAVRYDKESALFHLDIARRCGVLEAIVTVAQMAFKLPHDLLKGVGDDEIWPRGEDNGSRNHCDQEKFAFELMETAAEMGDRSAMWFVAEAYETGRKMGRDTQPSYPEAIKWYEKMVGCNDEDDTGFELPRYKVLAKIAQMYQDGGCGLTQNFERAFNLFKEAAEVAMEAMQGKLALRYYEQAEMCVRL